AQGEGERENPLPDGNLGQHAIDEMRRGVGHPATAAGGAEPAPLAGECYDPILPAVIAVHTGEAVCQHAALQKRAQLAFDEPGHRALAAALPRQEGLELRGDDAIEDILPRITRAVTGERITNDEGPTHARQAGQQSV